MAPSAPTEKKATPKVQRSVVKTNQSITTKNRSSPRIPFATTTKKSISSTKKRVEKIPIMNITLVEPRRRRSTVPAYTAQPKENITASAPPDSVKKPTWKRRPKNAHSGVPVPKKMEALKRDLNDSL